MDVRSGSSSSKIAGAIGALLRAAPVCAPMALAGGPCEAESVGEALSADIPAQPLAEALQALANQTGLQLVYVSGVIRGQRSHAVRTGMRAHAALERMLAGSGLRFEYLTAHSVRILDPLPAAGPEPPPGGGLPEVIVTANRRAENLQDVPMKVQVLTSATLARLAVETFDDFVGFLPAVTAHGVGPSQNNIYIRGVATGEFGNQAAGSNASFPSVALYLDEQSAELPGRNLDVYAADLDRIEVLEGPQGTLFGAGAEAGALRYITNKPRMDVTEGKASAGYAVTAHGDPSSSAQAVINLPIIAGRAAVRGVVYEDRRGGYINNIPATFLRSGADRSLYYTDYHVPANSVVINNGSLVANHINPVTYGGVRLEALYRFNEDWTALITQSYQNMEADGVFAEQATNSFDVPQPDLTVQLYNPSYDKDRFENTALTIEGRLAELELLYAGAYLVRHIEQVQDYTAYSHSGFYVDYYQCVNPKRTPQAPAVQCFSPSETWRNLERNTHLTQELRLTTPADWRLRGVGGLFYEDYRIFDQGDWFYLTAYPYFRPLAPPTGVFLYHGQEVCGCTPGAVFEPYPVTLNNPKVRPLGDAYFNDITRGYEQRAAYASLDFDLIPRLLTLTAGTRYFDTRNMEVGAIAGSFGCGLGMGAPNPCLDHSLFNNLNYEGLRRTYAGFRSRGNLSLRPRPDLLFYYTWSQGFRPGGFNRSLGPPASSPLNGGVSGGWSAPMAYAPDTLTNQEIGWKTSWADGRAQWDGALYQEDWQNAQIGALDARVLGGGATINGGAYRIRGIETSIQAHVSEGWTVEAGAAFNHSALVKEAVFYWADGKPIDFGSLGLSNPAGTLGSPLAGAPAFQGNLRLRYEWTVSAYRGFAQLGAAHQSHSASTTDRLTLDIEDRSVAYDLPGFTTYDGALGGGKGPWMVQINGENLSDTRAQLFANFSEGYKAVTVNRPRTIGLRMTYSFGGG